ncbi:LuxR C-terminal-related transcriptional regulator [Rhodobacter ferrooxidans]|uniref:Transcriptional regulator, LuxR family n=1 Tax=Rhodobacter ferrooxidans TaxID=371731 RepID=C8S0Z1_9RHOB|nr:LuxR C-terminal-related transcriptional regulator [Rhodobacter sp. SW2]EEW25432.1 transcriptional regulator, LuxR family [Rhodobacter sp. SW2]
MKETGPKNQTAQIVARDHRAEIVDRLYDVALDPIRLDELLEVWEGRVAPLRVGPVETAIPIEDPEIEAHIGRARVFLDRFEATREDGGYRSILADIPRAAAFISNGGSTVAACNRAAAQAFGIAEGAPISALPLDAEDITTLRSVIRKVAAGRAEKVITLRIRSTLTGGPVIMRVSPVESAEKPPLALVLSTELVWPEGFEVTVQEAFDLTAAEVEIVRSITLGLPLKDIAEARGRSLETVRTQVRSILAKTETHGQSELVRVVLGLMDVSLIPSVGADPLPRQGGLDDLPFHSLHLPDGRRLTWIEFGDPAGAPLLYMHLDYGLIRWTATAERQARARGIRVIVPVRAGYGRSDLHARGVDHLTGCTEDYAAVLEHLGVTSVAILALGADLRFAINLSLLRPGLVRGIVGCAAQLPLRTAAQYDRMDKWQRFILANARYAPRVLPFLVQAGFSLARRLGKEAFFAKVNGGSPADMETFARADVREAVLAGSEVTLGPKLSVHEAFTRECISSEKDWSGIVRACVVPVVLLQGDQDPQTPMQTIRELMGDFPHLQISFVPHTGQLLFFAAWQQALAALEPFLPR